MAPTRRTLGLAIAVTATLTVTGCGGDGDPTAFASATDRTCRDVATAVTTLRKDLVRRTGTSEASALAGAINAYARNVDAAAKRLAATDPPKKEQAFRDEAVRQLRAHASGMREATADARKGRLSTKLATQLQQTGPAAMPSIPQSILDDAPACRAAVR